MSQFNYINKHGPKDIGRLLDDTIEPKDKARLLIDLFAWDNALQGFKFWADEHNNLLSGNNFSHEALMSLTVEYNNGTDQ